MIYVQVGRQRQVGYIKMPGDGCWIWQGSCDPAGYGQAFNARLQRTDKAHRVIWEMHHGPLPPHHTGRELDHLCHRRNCVRPDHLRLVTVAVNRRARRWKPTTPTHGRPSCYTAGCRCGVCRDAWRRYVRQRRATGRQPPS